MSIRLSDKPQFADDKQKNAHILFVDDDTDVIRINKMVLEQIGYDVTTSTGAKEALDLFENYPQKFDLVITDISMPGLCGFGLTRKLLEIRHDIAVIICSGDTSRETEDKIMAVGAKAFITKPATIQTIKTTIRTVLN